MKIQNIIAAIIGFLSFAAMAGAADLAPSTYRVTSIKGTAQWQNPPSGGAQSLKLNQELPEGAVVSTGEASSIVLLFSTGSTAVIGANSELVVTKFQQQPFKKAASTGEPSVSAIELKLNKGTVSSRVNKLLSQSTYVIKTPVGVAGVRGTTFQVIYDPGTKTLSVLTAEGNVVFTTAAGVDVPVDGGQKIIVNFDVNDKGEIIIKEIVQGSLSQDEIRRLLQEYIFPRPADTGTEPILSDDRP